MSKSLQPRPSTNAACRLIVRTQVCGTIVLGGVAAIFITQPLVLGIVLGSLLVLLATTIWSTRIVESRWARGIEHLSAGAKQLSEGEFGWRRGGGVPPMMATLAASLERIALDQGDRILQMGHQQGELQGILQAMRTGVIALSTSGHVLHMNPAATTLLELDELDVRGHTLAEIGVDPQLDSLATSAMAVRSIEAAELVLDSKSGQRLVVHAEPTHDDNGDIVGIVLMLDDVTRLRRLEHMRADFAANVSHELRTPITSIQGYAELLAGEPESAERAKYATIIERNAARLSAIIEDLLSLSQLEGSTAELSSDRVAFSIHELLDEVVRACADEAASRDVTLKVDCGEHFECVGIQRLLEQALGNLVVNAIRYGPKSGMVVLDAQLGTDGEVHISVTDDGPGIAAEHRNRIFERFYRVDGGRSREVGGTGLGLSIVKHIAIAHGGRVEVDQAPTEGAVFSIILPLAGSAGNASEQNLSASHTQN
jgi:two-component system phosphate regulon sensor histidine kinase PhoR